MSQKHRRYFCPRANSCTGKAMSLKCDDGGVREQAVLALVPLSPSRRGSGNKNGFGNVAPGGLGVGKTNGADKEDTRSFDVEVRGMELFKRGEILLVVTLSSETTFLGV